MLRKLLIAALVSFAGLAAVGAGLWIRNATPEVPPITAAELAAPTKPFVVKLHAQWCPICMLTKHEWAEIEATYGDRVNLVVFDSTTAADREASRVEARRLGLLDVVDNYFGATGMVLVIDPRTRKVVREVAGNQEFEVYRAAIDAVLEATPPRA